MIVDKAFGAPRIARITAVALMAVLGGGGSVGPAEIRLLSAAAMQSVFKELIGDFEHSSGHRLGRPP
jgi:ABC-type molybdate transport system substrate-binding protein